MTTDTAPVRLIVHRYKFGQLPQPDSKLSDPVKMYQQPL
jgi:hypothetical protein